MQIIQHIELSSAQSSIVFSSIPQTFTDLLLVTSLRDTTSGVASGGATVTFNSNTSSYSERLLYTQLGGSPASASRSGGNFEWAIQVNGGASTSNTFSTGQIYIANYAGNANKSISSEVFVENNSANNAIYMNAGLWANTAAITSIQINVGSGNFAIGSSATLYGITRGSTPGVTVS